MSPEQARGREDVDYRTDVWSLCVVLYEAITGVAPFSASNYNALLRAIVEDEPKSLTEHAAGDAELWQILRRGLAKNRDERYRSMAEFGRSLAIWLLSQGTHEDATGAAVDSKWLGRSSDPLSLGDGLSKTIRPASISASAMVTHDSLPRAHHVDSRAPFTATIRPNTSARARALRVAGAAAALLAGVVLTFTLSTKTRPGSAEVRAAGIAPLAPTTATAVASHPAPVVTIAAPSEPSASAPTAVNAPRTSQLMPTAKLRPPAASKQRTPALTHEAAMPATPVHPAVPVKPAPRDLDLISPY